MFLKHVLPQVNCKDLKKNASELACIPGPITPCDAPRGKPLSQRFRRMCLPQNKTQESSLRRLVLHPSLLASTISMVSQIVSSRTQKLSVPWRLLQMIRFL